MSLLNILDGNGNPVTVIARTPISTPPADQSGSIATTNASQVLLNQNATRSDWFFQNLGANPMFISETNAPATSAPAPNATSVMVPSLGTYPPPDRSWVYTGQINITGTAGDQFACLEVSG